MTDTSIEIETDGEAVLATCPDCGGSTKQVWGYVSNSDGARAVYFVCWTEGHPEHGANLALSIGLWGDGTTPADRSRVGLECKIVAAGPQFMVVDASDLRWRDNDVLGAMLTRDAVMGEPDLAREAFSIVDRIVESDPRFHCFLVGASEPPPS